MNKELEKWGLYIILCIIWGSSFLLMFKGLESLSSYQVAAIRVLAAGLVMLPIAIMRFKEIQKKDWLYVFLTGVLGSLLPGILFCLAENEGLSTALTGTLNALTPIFVMLVGVFLFGKKVKGFQIIGLTIALVGAFGLLLFKDKNIEIKQWYPLVFIIIATVCYGLNVNLVSHKLQHINSMTLATTSLASNIIPCLFILLFTNWDKAKLVSSNTLAMSVLYSSILGIIGTAIATVLFYKLMRNAGYIFASFVTYGIPIMAVVVSYFYFGQKEALNVSQYICMALLLLGVYIGNGSYIKSK